MATARSTIHTDPDHVHGAELARPDPAAQARGRAETLTADLRQVHLRAARARLRHDARQRLRRILLSSLQGAAITRGQDRGRAARVHDAARRRRGRDRHHPQPQGGAAAGRTTASRARCGSTRTARARSPPATSSWSTASRCSTRTTRSARCSKGGQARAWSCTIGTGRGYVPAERNKGAQHAGRHDPDRRAVLADPEGQLQVTNARVGQQTDYDRLTLEVWTNGAVRPDDAVAFAAKILKEQLNIFINFEEAAEPVEAPRRRGAGEAQREPVASVDELELSVRSANCLQNANIQLHRRAGAEDRVRDAEDQELRPQVAEGDQGDPGRDGPLARA